MSMSGGAQVRWREDGRELFYIALDGKLMAVPIAWPADGQPPVPGTPEPLFTTHVGPAVRSVGIVPAYVVYDRGQRFLMNNLEQDASPTPIRWIPELEARR